MDYQQVNMIAGVIGQIVEAINNLADTNARAHAYRAAMIEVNALPLKPGDESPKMAFKADSFLGMVPGTMEWSKPIEQSNGVTALPQKVKILTIFTLGSPPFASTDTYDEVMTKLRKAAQP